MANELTLQVYASLVNGKSKELFDYGALLFDQAAVGSYSSIVNVGTSEEVVATGDIATMGYMFFRNLDSANYVQIGPESAGAMVTMIRVKAGQVGCLPLEPGITIRAKANTGAVKLKVLILEA